MQAKDNFVIRIIDDDADVRESLEILLEGRGWNTRSYASAEEYLANDPMLQAGCLLLDVKMPGMDGVELQQKLLEEQTSPFIIFLTAHGNIDMAVNVMRSGACDFMQKPVDPEILCARLEEIKDISGLRKYGFNSRKELNQRLEEMSQRELQMLKVLSQGEISNKAIGARLGLKERTIEGHRSSLYRELHVHDFRGLSDLIELIRSNTESEELLERRFSELA